ncbi:CaiB/BaiF CoA transferase family protein [Nocardia flavorosea]|uniref:CoA transferase n=1 Tax=Nocardia flavorosea TaxID=53429 RepID=A0A846YNC1_9NOCA|nr:CoA transferase [Nocardia flavorosea]NKY58952.1 CoA transferase [Nocardia flavorosea]
MSGALAGLRVIDTATLYAAPYLATLLADHGADVVKIEPPGGDSYRHHPGRMWPLLARGKRSVELDLRSEAGCAALRRLVVDTDVLVVNMPLATLRKRGLDYSTLRALNPGLIYVSVTGYGQDGPYADRPGNGTIAEAFSGLTHVTGEQDGPPILPSVPTGDAVTALTGAFGVLAACYHRLAHGGGGQLIDVNPIDSLLQAVAPVHTAYEGSGEPPARLGSRLRDSVVRNVFPTEDGRWVAIGASTPRHLADLAALAGHETRDEAGAPVGDVEASLRKWTSKQHHTVVVAELVERRLPVSLVQNARDIRDDPHVRSRACLTEVTTAEQGAITVPAPAPRLSGTPAKPATRTPDLGRHTGEVLGE